MRTWCSACVVAAWWCVAAAGGCDVTIGDRNYRKETLVSDVYWSRGLAVDFNTHYLYFSFHKVTQGIYRSVKVDFRTMASSVIEELSGPCWFTVDQMRGEVHAGCCAVLGGIGGLYQWDSNTGQFELAGEAGRDVVFVHYHNDTLYYSDDVLLHTFTHGQSARLPMQGSRVILDAQGDYIFTNATGVYRRRGSGDELRYAELGWLVPALAVDGRGAAYACGIGYRYGGVSGGLWLLPARASATRLLDVDCTDLTFDAAGNIVYADYNRRSIVRLVPC